MLRIFPLCVVGLCVLCGLSGQTPAETRLDEAEKQIAALKQTFADLTRSTLEAAALRRTVADQDRRIAALERSLRTLQTQRAVSAANAWRTAEAWAAIKMGMSRAQVVDVLGEPKLNDSVMDRQTLSYKDEANVLIGTVVIVDDRVSEVASPAFQVYLPLRN